MKRKGLNDRVVDVKKVMMDSRSPSASRAGDHVFEVYEHVNIVVWYTANSMNDGMISGNNIQATVSTVLTLFTRTPP